MDLLTFSGVAASISLLIINVRHKEIRPEDWSFWEVLAMFCVSVAGTAFWVLITLLLVIDFSKVGWGFGNILAFVGTVLLSIITVCYMPALGAKLYKFMSHDRAAKRLQPGFEANDLIE